MRMLKYIFNLIASLNYVITSDMTYDALGSLLAKYNVDLETFMG